MRKYLDPLGSHMWRMSLSSMKYCCCCIIGTSFWGPNINMKPFKFLCFFLLQILTVSSCWIHNFWMLWFENSQLSSSVLTNYAFFLMPFFLLDAFLSGPSWTGDLCRWMAILLSYCICCIYLWRPLCFELIHEGLIVWLSRQNKIIMPWILPVEKSYTFDRNYARWSWTNAAMIIHLH